MLQACCVGAAILAAAFIVAAVGWSTLGLRSARRAVILVVLAGGIFALPAAFRLSALIPRVVVTLTAPLFAASLLDLHIDAANWQRKSLTDWLRFLLIPVILVHRRYEAEPRRPVGVNVGWLVRGALEMAAGLVLLLWAHHAELGRLSFFLDHLIVALAAYLLALDGFFVLMTGGLRLMGLHVMDQSRHPILARTPADFWRRYNREAGVFLFENVFKPVGGLRRPEWGIAIVFLINGLYHEYLFTVVGGELTGLLLLFFALHGAAVASTFRLRLRGVTAVAGAVVTQLFLLATSVLFFAAVDRVLPLYSDGSLL